jgi:hypothetical protein
VLPQKVKKQVKKETPKEKPKPIYNDYIAKKAKA